jgi:hypothetical protein
MLEGCVSWDSQRSSSIYSEAYRRFNMAFATPCETAARRIRVIQGQQHPLPGMRQATGLHQTLRKAHPTACAELHLAVLDAETLTSNDLCLKLAPGCATFAATQLACLAEHQCIYKLGNTLQGALL